MEIRTEEFPAYASNGVNKCMTQSKKTGGTYVTLRASITHEISGRERGS